MADVKFIIKSPDLTRMEKIIKAEVNSIRRGFSQLALQAELQMKSNIRAKRTGSTGELKSSITHVVVSTPTSIFAGVGDTVKMFAEAPYWYVVNYGSKWPGSLKQVQEGAKGPKFIPPPNYGRFPSGAPNPTMKGKGTENWVHTGKSSDFLMRPTTFRPMNYIQNTTAWLVANWSKYWSQRIK